MQLHVCTFCIDKLFETYSVIATRDALGKVIEREVVSWAAKARETYMAAHTGGVRYIE